MLTSVKRTCTAYIFIFIKKKASYKVIQKYFRHSWRVTFVGRWCFQVTIKWFTASYSHRISQRVNHAWCGYTIKYFLQQISLGFLFSWFILWSLCYQMLFSFIISTHLTHAAYSEQCTVLVMCAVLCSSNVVTCSMFWLASFCVR